jgi:hypothetical protein
MGAGVFFCLALDVGEIDFGGIVVASRFANFFVYNCNHHE